MTVIGAEVPGAWEAASAGVDGVEGKFELFNCGCLLKLCCFRSPQCPGVAPVSA